MPWCHHFQLSWCHRVESTNWPLYTICSQNCFWIWVIDNTLGCVFIFPFACFIVVFTDKYSIYLQYLFLTLVLCKGCPIPLSSTPPNRVETGSSSLCAKERLSWIRATAKHCIVLQSVERPCKVQDIHWVKKNISPIYCSVTVFIFFADQNEQAWLCCAIQRTGKWHQGNGHVDPTLSIWQLLQLCLSL